MTFKRYEIRWEYFRSFYEGGYTFEYLPFDTKAEALAYINEHPDECKSDPADNMICTLYLVTLHSHCDEGEVVLRF